MCDFVSSSFVPQSSIVFKNKLKQEQNHNMSHPGYTNTDKKTLQLSLRTVKRLQHASW